MSDTPELLPCPLCGGEAGPAVQYAPASSTFVARVNCVRCHLCMMEPHGCDVRKLWNRRSPSAAYAAGAEAAFEMVAEVCLAPGAVNDAAEVPDAIAALPLPTFDREAAVEKMAREGFNATRGRAAIYHWPGDESTLAYTTNGWESWTLEAPAADVERARSFARAALAALMGER